VRQSVNQCNIRAVKSKAKLPDFEQSLTELEALVAKLEQGDVPLEEALKTFERGVALTRQCQASLQAAQQKVEILLKRGARAEIEPFEESADEGAAAPDAPE